MRPTSLIRSDSDAPEFTAPAVNIRKDAIDCGITVLPCCLPPWFHRFATPNWFLLFFIILGIVQGSAQVYFASTVRYIGEIFGYSEILLDWLIISNDLFLGLLVIFVAHFGNKHSRPAWIGGLACFQGFSFLLVIIPYLDQQTRSGAKKFLDHPSKLCVEINPELINFEIVDQTEPEFEWILLIVLFIAQFCIGLANASFFTHGFSYLDDNIHQKSSLLYISAGLAIRLATVQFGSFMAWSLMDEERGLWIGYAIMGGLLIFSGSMLALFPRKLLDTIIKQTAESILDFTSGNLAVHLQPDDHLGRSLLRMITNKIVIFNTIAISLMLMAMYNFLWFEPKFMESQFYLPSVGVGFDDPWKSRLWKNISKPTLTFLFILISGFIMSFARPRARSVVAWNVTTTIIVAVIYFSYGFIDCHKGAIAGAYKGHLNTPYCSLLCNCKENSKFEPVCTQDTKTTYYSPCHAGCQENLYMDSAKVYGNCTCASDRNRLDKINTIATKGACDNSKCSKQWIVFQSLTVFASAILGSGFLGSFFVSLRAVFTGDRAMVIAFQFFFIGIFTHIPGKFMYKAIADTTCQFYNEKTGHCNIQNERFGDRISYLTSGILLASALFYTIVLFFAKNLELFEDDDTFDYPETPMPIESRVETRPMADFSTPSPVQSEASDAARPLRPRRIVSGASTRASSIEFRNSETQPLNREQNHERVIRELKHLTGTSV